MDDDVLATDGRADAALEVGTPVLLALHKTQDALHPYGPQDVGGVHSREPAEGVHKEAGIVYGHIPQPPVLELDEAGAHHFLEGVRLDLIAVLVGVMDLEAQGGQGRAELRQLAHVGRYQRQSHVYLPLPSISLILRIISSAPS